jgi:hypothetical protein
MSTHTPAPWVLTISSGMVEKTEHTIAEIGTTGSYRGAVTRLQSAEHIDGIGKDELIANARLIAAAPDMLEALKALRDDVAKLKWGQPYPGRNHALMDHVDVAIAKAEGRT